MADFKVAHALTAQKEGGYANDGTDRGGRTMWGIAHKANPNWEGWPRLMTIIKRVGENATAINREANSDPVLKEMRDRLYKRNYWDVNKLDQVKSQAIANELFDTGVNMGIGVAARMLQEALNLCNKNQIAYPDIAVDGMIGPATLSTLNNKANEMAVLNTLNMLQGERYLNIMRNDKKQEKFWQSWLSRVLLNGKW